MVEGDTLHKEISMKRRTVRTYTVCACLVFLAIAFFEGACGNGTTGNGGAVTAPDLATIRTALSANNPFGIVPGLALGEITLPECTTDDSQTLTYSMTDLPDWLAFDATTRALALVEGTTVVPQTANTAAEVTYTCTAETAAASTTASAKATDDTSTASASFTVNDLDGGGVVDGEEYEFGEVPLMNPSIGWIWLTPGDVDLYRTAEVSKIPTGVIVTSVGMDPTDAADDTGDFDGDGSNNGDEITNGTNMFVATSDGTLANDADYNTGTLPKRTAVADVDGDGDIDLAVTEDTLASGAVRILLGDGDGTFIDNGTVLIGATPDGVVLADFDGDGNMDLATTTSANVVSVNLGNGDGTFGAKNNYNVGNDPESIVTGDFNRDGVVDIATTDRVDNTVSVLLGNGDGTFPATGTVYTTAAEPLNITAADFDGDGNMDLATANQTDANTSVFLGNGDGTFGSKNDYAVGTNARGITSADFDGDGNIDLAFARGDSLAILIGDGTGAFSLFKTYTVAGSKLYEVVAADFDGDSVIDLAIPDANTSKFYVFMGNGDGTFAAVTTYTVASTTDSLTAADFNADGEIDLAVIHGGGGKVGIFLNQ